MARIILKSPYLKPGATAHIANHIRYIATREGVVRPADPKQQLPATQAQRRTVAQVLRDFPDAAELYEHEDFKRHPTRENADEFLLRAAEAYPQLLGGREKYVDYIATRPGVVNVAGHGLFSDTDAPIVLAQAASEVANHTGNVWCHIISLRREDAARLGYDSVDAWQQLLRSQRNVIARQMKIKPENFRWYAAFHDKEHHPHVHMMAWSADPAEPWLTEQGIAGIKSALARQIFRSDLLETYQRQTAARDALRHIDVRRHTSPEAAQLLLQLAEQLRGLTGKKVYRYLPPDAKALVDRVVDALAADEQVAQLYAAWCGQREAVLRTYADAVPERVPLSRCGEFAAVKNAVIAEAMGLAAEPEPEEKRTEVAVIEEESSQPSANPYQHQSKSHTDAALASLRLLGQLTQMINARIADTDHVAAVDSKLRRAVTAKKRAHGQRLE